MKTFSIEYKSAFDTDLDDPSGWEEWSYGNAEDLLEEFVNAVSNEEIDDINLYWRVSKLKNGNN